MNLRQGIRLDVVNCCPPDCELNSYCKDVHHRLVNEEIAVAMAQLACIGEVLAPPLNVVAVTRCSPDCSARSGDGMPDVLPDMVVTVKPFTP